MYSVANIDTTVDTDVAWAKRQETIRGILKLFRVIVSAVRQHAELIQSNVGISAAQYWILSELARTPGARALDIAKFMAMHVAVLRDALSDLERQHLVVATLVGDNPKSSRWAITHQGRQRLAMSDLPARGSVVAALDTLDDSAIKALADSLQPLVAALRLKDEAAALVPLSDMLGRQ